MKLRLNKSFYMLMLVLGMTLTWQLARAAVLDENCVVNILNRTVQVNADGSWSMPNVPSQMGRVRARATCTKLGDTFSGESDYFNIVQNGVATVPDIKFENIEPVPVSLQVTEPVVELLSGKGLTAQLKVLATYRDGTQLDVSSSAKGINYTSSNPAIASVNADGLVTSVASGSVLITARKDEVVAFKRISVSTNGDNDNDGVPDDFELANGMNPNDALDAQEDYDQDGLTNKQEFELGTAIKTADSDGDGINDGEEVAKGTDGFITDPLKADTDGDGVSDRNEILTGYNPTDKTDGGGRSIIELVVTPSAPTMTFNTVYNEANLQVKISGKGGDGSLVDLTSRASGTSYSSSNLSVLSFGAKDGLLFAGQAGTANLTVRNGGLEKTVTVTVGSFNPTALSSITIPGYANNVEVAGDYAYVAAGSSGLQIVNVSNRASPSIVGSLDTLGTAIDVRVVGNVAYLADGDHGLQIIDITDPAAPVLLASYETAGIAQDVKIDKQFAYIADGNNGLEIVDVRKPDQPLFAGALTGLGEARGVDAQGNTVVVVAGSSLFVIDATDKANLVKKGSLGMGPVKDVALNGQYAYVAAYTSGYKTIDIIDPTAPVIVAEDARFYPFDVELTDGFAFFAEALFINSVPYVNIEDPTSAAFQGTVDFNGFNDYNGTGLALDSNYLYLTASGSISDYESTGNSTLLIGQYRLTEDKGGVPPTIEITEPGQDAVVVEGKKITVTANAEDDIGVKSVSFLVNGEVAYTDTSRPYQYPVKIPFGSVNSSIIVAAKASDFAGNSQTTANLNLIVQADTDHDGLSDEQEKIYKSNAAKADSDDDGINDGDEVDLKTNPIDSDSDDDGITDGIERQKDTDPLNPDVTPPTVASTSPANDAKDIPENNPIIINFSEPLLGKSISTASIKLYKGLLEGAPVVSGRTRLSGDGLQLIFTASELLEDFTDYKIVVEGIRDRAGNPIAAAYSFHYKTGNTLDTTPPSVVGTDPSANAANVAVNAVLGVRFSEPVNADTVNDQSIQVHDNMTGQIIPGVVNLSGDAQSLTFVPNAAFAVGRLHYITVTNAIKDLFDNPINYSNFYFTTAFDKDAVSPKVTGFSVAAEQIAVPTNVLLQVQFDEVVSGLSLSGIELRKAGEVIATTRELSADHKTLTLKLAQPLLGNTAYTLHVEGVEDLSGNVIANVVERNFTTAGGADVEAASLVQYSPANAVSNVGTNAKIVVELNERINPLTLNSDSIALYDTVTGQRNPLIQTLSADGKTVTMTPKTPLVVNRQYYVYLSYWATLLDQAGNRVNYTYWYFIAGNVSDLESPILSGRNIVDGSTGVAVNSKLRFVLDEAVSNFSVAGSVRLQANGVDIPGTVSLANDNRTLIFTPTDLLAINTDYTVIIDGLYDYVGNKFTGLSSHFSTGATTASDTSAPTVTVSPAYGSDGVNVNTPITFTFSEAIDPTTLDGGITIGVSGINGEPAGTFSRNGNVVTFSPLSPLPGNRDINITIYGVLDFAGNINSYTTSYFKTGTGGDTTAPTLVSISPTDGAMDVATNTAVVLTFSESLNQSTVTGDSVGLFINGNLIKPAISYSGDSRTVTLSANLANASLVTVLLTNDIKDLSGNRLADTVKVFTTAVANDNARPSIATALPGNGAYNVLSKNKIVLYSNEPLKASTVAPALHVSQNGVLVNGTIQLIGDGRTLVFTPNTPWRKEALVEVFMDSTVEDQFGNALNSYYGSFRTEEDASKKTPYVIAVNTDDGVALPLNPAIDLQFNEALDAATVSNTTFVLRDNSVSGNPEVPLTVSLGKGQRVVRLVPKSTLQTGHVYYVGVRAGVKDAAGQDSTYNYDYYWNFTAGAAEDGIAPKVVALTPTEGATQVGINNRMSIQFDEAINPISLLTDDADLPLAHVAGFSDARNYSLNISDGNRQIGYLPHEPWPADSDVSVTVTAAEDYAGHGVVSASHSFHTAKGPDTVAPTIDQWNIVNNATFVPTNTVLKVKLSEAVDPQSVNQSSFYIYDNLTGQKIAVSRAVSSDGRTLTLVPEQALAVRRSYILYVYGVQDMNGNAVYQYRYFSTANEADSISPQIVAYSITADQTAVATNVQLQALFDEPISDVNLAKVGLFKGSELVATTPELSGDRKTLGLKFNQPLAANTVYTFHIEGVEDLTGNVLSNIAERRFTTGTGVDLSATSLVQYSPANIARNVGRNTKVVVEFNERINPLSVNSDSIAIYDAVTGQRIPSTASFSADGKTITMTPTAELVANRQYYVYLSYWAYLFDQAGNQANYTYWYFTTGAASDLDSPVIKGRNIENGATDIAVNSKVRVVLDEGVSNFSIAGSVRVQANGVDIPGTLSLGTDNRTLTFTPTNPLATNTVYTILIDGLYDYIGNKLTAVSSQFTTGANNAADTTPPIATISPANTTADVSVNSPITFAFNEAIDATTLEDAITINLSGIVGEPAGTFTRNGNVVTFSPLTPWPGNSQINITVYGVLDFAGNINSYATSYFKTGTGGDTTAPTLVSISPTDGAMDVAPNNAVVLTFSESLNQSTVTGDSVGLFINGSFTRPGISYSGDSRTVTLSANLANASLVTVLLTNDIKDLSGNRLADTIKVFTTAAANDNTRPSVATALPGNGAYNVFSKNKIVLYSNEPLKASTVAAALHVSQNGVLVNGSLQLIGDGRALVFTPTTPWRKEAMVEVFLDSTAQDQSGNALNSYYGSFRTEEDASKKTPYVIAVNTDDSVVLPLNPAIDLQFNEALDATTVTDTIFVLRDTSVSGNPEVPLTVSLNKGQRVVRLVPKSLLQAGHSYSVGVRAGLKDAAGQDSSYNYDYYWGFTAGTAEDGIAPKVVALTPTAGAPLVGINNRISIRFDEAINPISLLTDDAELPLAQLSGSGDARNYSAFFSAGNRQFIYLAHEPWPADSDVTVNVNTPEDYAGHVVAAASQSFHTTNGPDTTAPTIDEWSLIANAVNVPSNAIFKVRFNEQVDPQTVNEGTFYLYDNVTGQKVAVARSVGNDVRTLSLVPEQALNLGRSYIFYAYGIQDMNGNPVYQYRYFTTAQAADTVAPQIVGYNVDANQTAVPTNVQLQMQFDEPISELNLSLISLRKGSEVIATTNELSGDHKTLTIKIAKPLLANTVYTLHVEGVEDLSGNVLASVVNRNFTTGNGVDLVPTVLGQYSPANNATSVALNTPIVVEFNERLNPLTINSESIALYDTVTGLRNPMTSALSADGKKVTMTPTAALVANRQYYVYISYWAYLFDQAGNRMNNAYWYFTSGAN